MARPQETVGLPKRLPLVAEPENRDETTLRDAKLLNGFVEKNELTGEYKVYKRPGLLTNATYSESAATGLGSYNWMGDVYAIFGATMYKNGVALVGVLDTTGGIYRFSSSLGTTPRMQFGNGVATYNYDASAGIVQISDEQTITAGAFVIGVSYTILTVGTTDFTLIGASANTIGVIFTATGVGSGTGTATTATNFPDETVKGIVYLDGTTYVMTAAASIRGCAVINDTTDWTDLLNRITAQIEPDQGVALAKQLVYVLALKEWSTEVFYDALNATASPLGPVQGAKLNFGCANEESLQEIDGALFWISTNRTSSPQIVMMDNLKLQVISTPAIDRLLETDDLATVYSFGIRYEGHKFYGVTLVASNITLVYDMKERLWAQWTDSSGNYFPIVSTTFVGVNGLLMQHATNGKIYTFDAENTTDDGAVITWDLYTPNFDGGVSLKKTLNLLTFVGDQTGGSVLQVRCNDNDYSHDKWSEFRYIDLSQERPTLGKCGTFRRRAYHFRHQCATPHRMAAIELQLDLGTL